jgi:hypothetical protein
MRRAVSIALALFVIAVVTPAVATSSAGAATLPDGRGYEYVSPSLNGAGLYGPPFNGDSLADGSALTFQTIDPPAEAQNASVINPIVARRGSAGWSIKSVLSPLTGPATGFFVDAPVAISPDFTRTIDQTEQVLTPGAQPGEKLYYQRVDGSWALVTPRGESLGSTPGLAEWESADFTHLFFNWTPQLAEDPVGQGANSYEWSEAGGLRLVGVLPGAGHVLAPNGAALAFANSLGPFPGTLERPPMDPVSADGEEVLWRENGNPTLYLREHATTTVEPAASQRTMEPDPNPPAAPRPLGVTAKGTKVLFASSSELTNDAFTGRSGGAATDAGSDLYSYDIETGGLTDLTVDRNPADEAAGANVISVLGATQDGGYIYFTAAGDLAPGATSGAQNLYVEHNGSIKFVVSNPRLVDPGFSVTPFYVTPDGLHIAFLSSGNLTGYNNVNPKTGTPETEVYTYSYGGAVECASCRPSGEPPSGSAGFAVSSGGVLQLYPSHEPRTVSDDGSRVFFQSEDAIIPAAKNGLMNVYEYEGGHVYLLSSGGGNSSSYLLDAGASGDDVFFVTHDELVSAGQGTTQSVYDARVGAAPSNLSPPAECSGSACQGPATSPPGAVTPGSRSVRQPGRLVVYGSRKASAAKVLLAISIPATGQLSISGKGLRSVRKKIDEPGVSRTAVILSKSANRSRLESGAYFTKATIEVGSASGSAQRTAVDLRFFSSTKKGGK